MPRSDDDFGFTEEKAGQNLAVLAEALFLINLLLAPGIRNFRRADSTRILRMASAAAA